MNRLLYFFSGLFFVTFTKNWISNSQIIHNIKGKVCYNKIPFAPLTGERPGAETSDQTAGMAPTVPAEIFRVAENPRRDRPFCGAGFFGSGRLFPLAPVKQRGGIFLL
jgi:hypothetical protein